MSTLLRRFKTALEEEDFGKYQEEAKSWFSRRSKVVQDGHADYRHTLRPRMGRMYVYMYDPKYKKELPYYDRFPLVLVMRVTDNHILGLNMHYLSPIWRARLLNNLQKFRNNDKYDRTTRMRMEWAFLKSAPSKYRGAAFAVKKYRRDHLRSKMLVVQPHEWFTSLFLPYERFMKSTKYRVWEDAQEHAQKVNRAKKDITTIVGRDRKSGRFVSIAKHGRTKGASRTVIVRPKKARARRPKK